MFSSMGSTSGGKVTLSVGGAHGSTSHDFEEDLSSTFPNPVQVFPTPGSGPTPPGGASYELNGKTDGTYFYRVRAVNAYGHSGWVAAFPGAVVTGNPAASPPATPQTLSVPSGSTTGTITVSWTGVAGATAYVVEESTSPGFLNPQNVSPGFAQTTVTVFGRANGTYHYRVLAVNSVGQSAWRVGSNPCVVGVSSATCSVSAHASTPPFGDIHAGAQEVVALSLDVSAGASASIEMAALTITASGSGDDGQDVTGLRLYFDQNADGQWTSADTLLSPSAPIASDEGTVSFTGLGRVLAAGTAELWFVVADFAGTASGGEDFTFGVSAFPSGVQALDAASRLPIPVTGLPAAGTRLTVFTSVPPGSIDVAAGPNAPADGTVDAGSSSVVLSAFAITAGLGEDADLAALTFTASGSGDDGAHVVSATLVEDVDRDGAYSSGTDFSGDDGTLALASLGETIAAGWNRAYLLVCDLSESIPSGSTFRVTLGTGSVAATGAVTAQPLSVNGLPFSGRTVTVDTDSDPMPLSGGGCGAPTRLGGAASPGALLPIFILFAFFFALRLRRISGKA
jgi:hypothetical protein